VNASGPQSGRHHKKKDKKGQKENTINPKSRKILLNETMAVDRAQVQAFDAKKKLGTKRYAGLQTTKEKREQAVNKGQEQHMKGVSYETMKYVESLRHPRQVTDNQRVKFKCCSAKTGKLSSTSDDRAITEAEQELGIGIAIYFRQLKFFSWIFLALTITSLPSFLLYGSGPTH